MVCQCRYITAEQVPVKYGGLSKDGEFGTTDAVTEVTVRPAAKHTVEFPVTEVCYSMSSWSRVIFENQGIKNSSILDFTVTLAVYDILLYTVFGKNFILSCIVENGRNLFLDSLNTL